MGFSSFDHEGLNTQVLALVLSAIAYGFVVALASCCLLLLYRTTYIYSRQMLVFMYLYVIFMFGLSTTAIGQETRFTMQAVTGRTLPGLGWTGTLTALGTPIVLPFSIWGADGFMVWRCWVLYQGVGTKMRNALIALLVSLCLASLASGILLLVFVHKHADIELSIGKLTGTIPRIHDTSMALVASTAIVNAILALLIVLRLLFHQRYMIKALGDEHSSPYPKIMNICVESCALIFITSIAGIASLSAAGSNKYLIPMLLLPHVCVLSPLLIVYRVAQGRTAISPQPSDLDLPHTSDSNNIPQIRLEPIRFGPPVSILDSIPGLEDPTISYQNTPQPKFHLPRIATGSELFRVPSQQALPSTSPRSASV